MKLFIYAFPIKIVLITLLSFISSCVPFKVPSTNYSEGNKKLIPKNNIAFQSKEKLEYRVYFQEEGENEWVKTANVKFEIEENGDFFIINGEGKTNFFYSLGFKVKREYKTIFDKNNLLPYRSTTKIEEGGSREEYEKIRFNKEDGNIIIEYGHTKKDATTIKKEYKSDICDLVSAIYSFRNSNLEAMKLGQKTLYKILVDREIFRSNFTLKDKVCKEIKHDTFNKQKFCTFLIKPEVKPGGIFPTKDALSVWVTADKNHLPLQIEANVSEGTIRAVLKKHKGLKYHLSSKDCRECK